ncbi:DUF2274 domain-containing protein [Novosphingobium sp. TCA1]|uniref:DUF2274 domain-containing protein n=1 Tax=Novosphingobium pentaromativorans TaxID=205844 RepID=A0A2W5NF94_9SPHN|nr:DUF2274 domain-containing protein [Novosphingobium sp. TCA1]PZQ51814.1 MAG: DUF2274 domain-containing protein [Novosphingobium pentaromativorans]GFE76887.1 hypothetical protein NTCA1_45360 [Novosphingobium sp. TCA1]
MVDLKLPALPDRTPVKMSIHVMPELSDALRDYAKMYAAAYGREEPVSVLVPAMLEAFLSSDRAFSKSRARGAK